MTKNEYFKKRINEKVPMIIYPEGMKKKELVQIIAYGFIYFKGLYFFNSRWNFSKSHTPNFAYPLYRPKYSDSGRILNPSYRDNIKYYNSSGVFIHGYLSGPYEDGDLIGYRRYWKFGDAVIFQIRKEPMSNGVDFFSKAVDCRKKTKEFKDNRYKSLKAAKAIADHHMKNIVVDSDKHIKGLFDIYERNGKVAIKQRTNKI